MRTRIAVVAALTVVLSSACGGGVDDPDPRPSTPDDSVTSPGPAPRDAPPPPPPPGETPSPGGSSPGAVPAPGTSTGPGRTKPAPTVVEGELTVTGRLVEGVEPNCLLLRAGSVDYLLILPPDRRAPTGAGTLSVRGRVEPGLMTTCQQGTPFVVTEIRPN